MRTRLQKLEYDRKRSKKYYRAHRGEKRAYRLANLDRIADMRRKRRIALRQETMNHYGGAICACCGENDLRFLTIDHINNDGAIIRKRFGNRCGGTYTYELLRRLNWPDGIQVLCWNCNCGRAMNNGVCPHKEILAEGKRS